MFTLQIDNIKLSVPEGTTILKAAKQAGLIIPTMCFNKDVPNHASCMVCAVKNNLTGEFVPACEAKVTEGMDLSCETPEVKTFRKDALELLLSEHVGDCEAPCRVSCPANMDIPQMNRFIAEGKFHEALKVVKEEISLPLVLGYICSAPCENACRRKQAGGAVSICQLKKFVALDDLKNEHIYFPEKKTSSGKKVAVIGAGISGLACAFQLVKDGHNCIVFDKNENAGGSLLEISENILPRNILYSEIEILKQFGIEFVLNSEVTYDAIKEDFDAVIIATGNNSESNNLEIDSETFKTNISGVFACGSFIKPIKMAVKALASGKAAAKSVNAYLSGKEFNDKKLFNSRFGKLSETEVAEYLKESVAGERLAPSEWNLPGFTAEEAIAEAQRCMRCDCRKSKSCKLRNLSDLYNAKQQTYNFGDRKNIRKIFQNNVMVYEPEKCIKCGLCIKVASRNPELAGLAYIGRGFDIKIDIPFNKSLEEAISVAAKECIDVCPTSALSNFKGE